MQNILIIGTFPSGQHRLQKEFEGRAKLEFFDNKVSSAGLDKRARGKDLVILNSDLARHTHMYALRDCSVPLVITKGSHSAIARAINTRLEVTV